MILIKKQNSVLYKEIQRPRLLWLYLLVIPMALIIWYAFIQQTILGIPFGSKPAPDAVLVILWFIFGVAFPIIMIRYIKLIIEVREDGLYIRFMPFHFQYKRFLYKDILHYEWITYRPLERFGGWGIRVNLKGETAYSTKGEQGLELKLKHQTVVIGTQKPEQLKKAIDSLNR